MTSSSLRWTCGCVVAWLSLATHAATLDDARGTYLATRSDLVVEGRTCATGPALVPSHVLIVSGPRESETQEAVALLRDDSGAALNVSMRAGSNGSMDVSIDDRLTSDKSGSGKGTLTRDDHALVLHVDYRRALPDCRVRGRLRFERVDDARVRDDARAVAAAFDLAARADAQGRSGELREALSTGQQAVAEMAGVLGVEHPMTLALQVRVAELHWQLDELAAARSLIAATIASLERVVGSDTFQVLQARDLHARIRWYQGDVDDAERELRDIVRRHDSMLDRDDVNAIATLGNLAALLLQRGRLVEAERLMFDALARLERAAGPDDARTLITLNNLAVLLDNGGRLDESLRLYETLVERHDRTGNRAHPNAQYALLNQADTLGRLGRFDEAIPIAREVLASLHASLGSTHTDTLLAQHNLAWLLAERGDLDEAWILQRALVTLRDRVDGSNSREALKARNVLGSLEVRRGDASAGLARMASALDAAKVSLGEQDPTTLEIAARVAATQRAAGRLDEARRTLRELVARVEDWRDAGAMTADTRRAFLVPWIASYKSLAALDLAAGDVRGAFDQAERSKARVLVELLARRRGETPDVLPAQALEELARLDRALVDAETRIARSPDASARAPLELERIAIADEARRLRSDLRARHPKYAALSQARIVALDEGARALPPGGVFVSYLLDGDRIVAFTVDAQGRVRGRDLGAFAGLDDAVVAYRTLLLGPANGVAATVWRRPDGRYVASVSRPAGAQRVTDADRIGAQLTARLVNAIPEVRDAKRVIVSPDGALAILPFEALPLRGRPLVATHDVTYAPSLTVFALTAARAREYDRLGDRISLYAMGAARYDATGGSGEGVRDAVTLDALGAALKDDPEGVRRAFDFVRARWSPLPASHAEIRDVAAQFDAASVTMRAEREATERRLIDDNHSGTLSRHRYVLLSAHGLLSTEAPSLSAVVLGQDDLTPEADGYVTAAEWTGYTLRSDLIVISACQTGAGRIIAGEGVAGLPYALFVAGNRNALLTLWPIADASTAQFVARFFGHLRAGLAQSEALTRTKREFASRGRFRAPFYWAAFTLWGA